MNLRPASPEGRPIKNVFSIFQNQNHHKIKTFKKKKLKKLFTGVARAARRRPIHTQTATALAWGAPLPAKRRKACWSATMRFSTFAEKPKSVLTRSPPFPYFPLALVVAFRPPLGRTPPRMPPTEPRRLGTIRGAVACPLARETRSRAAQTRARKKRK